MMDSAIFLKKGVHVVACCISAMLVPPEEAPLEQAEGMHKHQGNK